MTRTYDKEQIYDTYYPKVVQYIRSHVGQQQDVEDLAQAVFIKLYGKLDLFDPEKKRDFYVDLQYHTKHGN